MNVDEMKDFNNDGRIKVYLAGPFFNDEQLERLQFMESLLSQMNYDVFSPMRASKIKPGASHQDMVDTFNGNVIHIDEADFVLAILDGNDVGTVWETGYAYCAEIPVMYFNETRPKEKGPNLMLAMSGGLPFIMNGEASTARTKLTNVLKVIQEEGLNRLLDTNTNEFKEVE